MKFSRITQIQKLFPWFPDFWFEKHGYFTFDKSKLPLQLIWYLVYHKDASKLAFHDCVFCFGGLVLQKGKEKLAEFCTWLVAIWDQKQCLLKTQISAKFKPEYSFTGTGYKNQVVITEIPICPYRIFRLEKACSPRITDQSARICTLDEDCFSDYCLMSCFNKWSSSWW